MPNPSTSSPPMYDRVTGFLTASSAFLIWGLSPIYFKALKIVPAYEILMHRIVWSMVLLMFLMVVFRRGATFLKIFQNRRLLGLLFVSTLLVATNWFLFIYAINSNQILQASLGYYINPLINVLLATLFLKERLRRLQVLAVLIAAVGVAWLTLYYGAFPGIALVLGLTFGLYGLVRKVAAVPALEGLIVETLLLSLPALTWLFYLNQKGTGTFLTTGLETDLLLAGTAFITAVPLLLFTLGVRRLKLTTIGFLQYLAPSMTFLLAVFIYNEPFAKVQWYTFACIWAALSLFTWDAVMEYRHQS